MQLPKRVFMSPLLEFANFEDGSFVNLIKLNKPYANGDSFAVYQTIKSPFCSNGLFKNYEQAKLIFELNVENGINKNQLIRKGIVNHSLPYPNNVEILKLNN